MIGDCSNLATVVMQTEVWHVCGKSHSGIVQKVSNGGTCFLNAHCCSMLVLFYIVRLGGNCCNGAFFLIPKQVLHVGGTLQSGIL